MGLSVGGLAPVRPGRAPRTPQAPGQGERGRGRQSEPPWPGAQAARRRHHERRGERPVFWTVPQAARARDEGMAVWTWHPGPAVAAKRDKLINRVFSLFFHLQPRFSCRRRRSGCGEASEIVGPTAKLATTATVDSCRFFARRSAATSPCRLPACRVAYLPMPGPRALCSKMSTRLSARAGVRSRRCPAPCPEKETVGFICQHASPPRHLRLFYELCAYIKSGSPPGGLFPPGPARSP
jgi:hypothetical protein